jgi:membrane fusion protein, multidrug efflux system
MQEMFLRVGFSSPTACGPASAEGALSRRGFSGARVVPAAIAFVLITAGLLLSGCKEQNTYAPSPPPKVGVAPPLQQSVTDYLEETGTTEAVNQVSLVARVKGFLSEINYEDAAVAKQGDSLFVIEPAPYEAQLQQAQAALVIAKAQLVQSQAELDRQQTLFRQNVTAESTLDQARAKRDTDQGNVTNAEAGVTIAAINLGYTHVTAPFEGVVTKHQVSVGELVGATKETTLANIVQLNPIYVTFNVSEQDALRVRRNLDRKLTQADFAKIPIEIGLMDEDGYPHKGVLEYIAPELDPASGTILVRGVLENSSRALIPGLFTRIRIPMEYQPRNALLVPNRILGTSQEGRYLLVVNKDDMVEQRTVKTGSQVGDLRVIESGIMPEDRVVITGAGRAVPGRKVTPQVATFASTAETTTTATK